MHTMCWGGRSGPSSSTAPSSGWCSHMLRMLCHCIHASAACASSPVSGTGCHSAMLPRELSACEEESVEELVWVHLLSG